MSTVPSGNIQRHFHSNRNTGLSLGVDSAQKVITTEAQLWNLLASEAATPEALHLNMH